MESVYHNRMEQIQAPSNPENIEKLSSPVSVHFNPNMGLVVLTTDVGRGKEETLMTLRPEHAISLAEALLTFGLTQGKTS